MTRRKMGAWRLLWAAAPVLTGLLATPAHAVPSYARQTGQDCVACHIGGYGPQLTPYGIRFKLGGYTDSDGKSGKMPLSGMVVLDYSKYKDDNNDNRTKSGLSEASVFLAGKLTDHLGSFVQVTHDGTEHHTSIDQADLRLTSSTVVADKDVLLGLSANNNPTVQDPFNTLPVWSFPYTSSPYANTMGAEFQGVGGTEQKVLGLNAYSLIDDQYYAELGLYNTLSPGIQSRLGLSHADAESFGRLNNAPYWRLGYMKDFRSSAFHAGVFGFNGSVKDRITDDVNYKFNDLGIDGSYQFLGTRQHVFTVNGSYIRETTKTNDGTGMLTKNTVKDYKLNASYFFRNTYGASLGYFKATGSDGNSGNKGFLYQLDWTPFGKEDSWMSPWANLRVGMQYVTYKRFVEYDDATGTATVLDKPSDKNTLSVFAWTAF